MLAARALSLGDRDRATACEVAVEAVKLCPGLVPAATLAGRLLAEAGEPRKAGRVLEAAWRENPHPDLADAYADLVPGAAAQDRLARMRALARLAAGSPESALAVAQAALDANEFSEARAALAPLQAPPTRRVATLMARLEEAEHGDTGRAREWMARALTAANDPAWTADGLVVETWLPVSPVTGRLDAFEWRAPVAGPTRAGPLIEGGATQKRSLAASGMPVALSAMPAWVLRLRPAKAHVKTTGPPADRASMAAQPGAGAPAASRPAGDTATATASLPPPDNSGPAMAAKPVGEPARKPGRPTWRSWFP